MRVFPATRGALCVGLLLVTGCSGATGRDEPASLSAAQVQSWAFRPRAIVWDMRRADPDALEDLELWPPFERFEPGSGWLEPEVSGTWMTGSRSTLSVTVDDTEDWNLYFSALAVDAANTNADPVLRFLINGGHPGQVELERRWADYVVPLPPGTLQRGRNEIAVSGRSSGAGGWPIQLRALGVIGANVWQPDAVQTEFDEDRGVLRVMRTGKLFVPIRAADNATSVQLGVTTRSFPWTTPVGIRATLQPVGRSDADPVVLAEESLSGLRTTWGDETVAGGDERANSL